MISIRSSIARHVAFGRRELAQHQAAVAFHTETLRMIEQRSGNYRQTNGPFRCEGATCTADLLVPSVVVRPSTAGVVPTPVA